MWPAATTFWRKSIAAHSIAPFLLCLVTTPTIPGAFISHWNFPSHIHYHLWNRPFNWLTHGNPQRSSRFSLLHWCHWKIFLLNTLAQEAKSLLKIPRQLCTGKVISWPMMPLLRRRIQVRVKIERCIDNENKKCNVRQRNELIFIIFSSSRFGLNREVFTEIEGKDKETGKKFEIWPRQ